MNSTSSRRLYYLSLFAGTLFTTGLFGQQIASTERHGTSELPDWITFHEGMTNTALVPVLESELGWPTGYNLIPTGRPIEERSGWTHQRYQQLYQGVPVFGATVMVHEKDGAIGSLNGELSIAGTKSAPTPTLSPEAALEAAMRHVGARSYMWDSPEMEAFIKKEQHDPQATFRPTPELIYYPLAFPRLDGELRLAYKLDIYAQEPRSRQYVLVDAQRGEILNSIPRMHSINEPGTAETAYSGNRPIMTFRPSTDDAFQLKDLSRGGGILTYDCANTSNYAAAQIPTNTTNNWDLGSLSANSILDAHWGTERTYDYYLDVHNWDSYDNAGSPMLSYAHFNLVSYGYPSNNNAFWDGQRMTYGDGNGTNYHPFTAIDVLGHEITHGVTEHSAGLIYQDESGALNESFSDIIGSCIEYYAKPEGFSWMIGNDMSVSGSGFRNLADPNQFGHPNTYQGAYWVTGSADNGGVHTNSGVQNYWFYLLTQGGSGTNDNGDAYSVQGIGFEEAGDIAFRNLTVYLNANSDYADARAGAIQATTDLFGGCSPQLIAVTNAWYAVGVGAPFSDAVVAGFSSSSSYSCDVPAAIQFTNTSINGDTYLWDFGDGQTSTSTAPSHTYDAPGNYTVSLIADGSAQCNSTDTLIIQQYITVENDGALTAAACAPAAINPTNQAGIFNFQFGDLNKASTGAVDGYQDFSCEQVATFTEGLSYPLNVILHIPGFVALWIDLDNDGAFIADEKVFASTGESMVHNADVIIPAASLFDTRLRVRVIASSQPISDACTVVGGQVEDNSARILDNEEAPIAAFTASPTTVLVGSTVTFQDLSLNAPTAWEWAFTGGDVTASSEQYPHVQYDAIGQYDVQVIVSNAHGSDTLLIPDFIHVVNSFNLCQVESTSSVTGTFFDPGGPTGNYGNNETCTLLIAPPCATSISVTFHSFATESGYDFLRFYDGSSASAPLLGQFSGNSLPAFFSTSGGQLFVRWNADQSVNASGFEVEWTTQTGSEQPINTLASASVMSPALGQVVQFTDATEETPSSWSWNFGDGSFSNAQHPTHAFLSSGPQTVVFTASNCAGTGSDTLHLLVSEPGALSIAPDTLQLSGPACSDSLNGSFTLSNPGAGPLIWSFGSRLTDDFEGGSANTDIWQSTAGVNSNSCGAHGGNRAHRFSMNGQRMIETHPLDIHPNTHFSFYLKYGDGGSCDDLEPGEHVVLEYALDGTTWNLLESYTDLSLYADWTQVDAVLPAAVASSQTRLRLRQLEHSGYTYDVWAIDDVAVDAGYSGPHALAPSNGTTAADENSTVSIAVNTANYIPGTHVEDLLIYTTDPSQPFVSIPVLITLLADSIPVQITHTNPDLANGTVDFDPNSSNAVEWFWDFGDSNTSTEGSPSHTYASWGSYTVILTAWNAAGCSATDTVLVQYGPVGIAELAPDAITVLPNPSHGSFILRLQNTSLIYGSLMDGTGRILINNMAFRSGDNAVDITGLADGAYILRLQIGEALRHLRIVKQQH